MKPTMDFDDRLLGNEDKFQDDFFKRFQLRHASEPLQLSDRIKKNYLFPTFYSDVTCAIAIFLCSYDQALNVVRTGLGSKIMPVKMTRNRSLVAFSCYTYKSVMNIPPYNEIAMTMPVLVSPRVNVPLLPMIMEKLFSNFGYYVFSMPVTSKENQIRGNKIWGLPKVTQEINIREQDDLCTVTAKEETGEPYLELAIPTDGKPALFDVKSNLYTRLGSDILQSETNFRATFNVIKNMGLLLKKDVRPDRNYITIGHSDSARILRELEIERHPFQFRYAKSMTSCFDLPNPDFQLSAR